MTNVLVQTNGLEKHFFGIRDFFLFTRLLLWYVCRRHCVVFTAINMRQKTFTCSSFTDDDSVHVYCSRTKCGHAKTFGSFTLLSVGKKSDVKRQKRHCDVCIVTQSTLYGSKDSQFVRYLSFNNL